MAAAGARYVAQMALPPLLEFGGIPRHQRQFMRVVEMQLEPPACISRRFQAPKMLIPRYLARWEGTCVFAWATAYSSGGSFMYVPARDHLCRGNAT